MPGPAVNSPEARARRPRALAATLLGVALLGGPFLPGAFLSGAGAPAGVQQAAAQEASAIAFGAAATTCAVTDERLPEISGIAVSGDTTLAMNDGGDAVSVYALDAGCAVTDVRTGDVDPYDPEDLALAADGTVWLADTGDNRLDRPTVALIALRPDGSSSVYRLSYPDGAHDAEALLLAPDGTPYLVTKEVLGDSGVYRPAAALDAAATVGLERVGQVQLSLTGTPGGPVGRAGQLLVTGGAVAPDGAELVLRTYTDAWVWPLAGSDVVGALGGQPVRVPLPEAPQGEAVSFGADGRSLVVSGEGLPADVSTLPSTGVLAPAAATSATSATGEAGLEAAPALSPWSAGVIAAVAATALVWTAGKIRRRA